MYESDDTEEAIAHIPLRNLPFAQGLQAFQMDPWEPGDDTKPNNVLISHIGAFDKVSMVGRDIDSGRLVFASSSDNIAEIIYDLHNFIKFLERYDEMEQD